MRREAMRCDALRAKVELDTAVQAVSGPRVLVRNRCRGRTHLTRRPRRKALLIGWGGIELLHFWANGGVGSEPCRNLRGRAKEAPERGLVDKQPVSFLRVRNVATEDSGNHPAPNRERGRGHWRALAGTY